MLKITTWAILLAAGILAVVAACTSRPAAPPAAEPPVHVVATTQQIMEAMVIPASNALFNVTVEEPQTDEDWAAVRNQAIIVTEAGNLLMLGNRMVDNADWVTFSRALIDAGTESLQAAQAKDVDAVGVSGDKLIEACMQCHEKYMPSTPNDAAPEGT